MTGADSCYFNFQGDQTERDFVEILVVMIETSELQ